MGELYGKKHNYNLDLFFNEDDISYYLLGALIADGCVNNKTCRITLTSADLDWIELIKNMICPTIKLEMVGNSYRININSKQLKTWLIDHRCVPKKSLTVKFPIIPNQYLPDFLRGCIDGDGSLGRYDFGLKCYLCGSSLQFLQSYSTILHLYGITNYITESKQSQTTIISNKKAIRRSKHWRVETQNKHTQKLISWIYYPNHKLSMPRKKLIADTIINHKFNPVGRKPNIEKQTKAIELRSNGWSLRQIARELHTSQSRVHCWISSA